MVEGCHGTYVPKDPVPIVKVGAVLLQPVCVTTNMHIKMKMVQHKPIKGQVGGLSVGTYMVRLVCPYSNIGALSLIKHMYGNIEVLSMYVVGIMMTYMVMLERSAWGHAL